MARGPLALEAAQWQASPFVAGHALARAVMCHLSGNRPWPRFPDGEDAWLVVASAGGSAHHPAWYHNIATHPDQVWIEFGGRQLRVTPTQLDGDARAGAWQRITQLQPRYAGYEQKTDRAIPVIRLSRAD
jgi:deazaflavin-dependent oxidoreductase (nitroreductase family)